MTTPPSASTSRKPSLTVLVGAGGSYDLGVPLTDAVTSIVRRQFEEPSRDYPNFFKDAGDAERLRLLLSAAESHFGPKMNFEHLFEFIESGLALHEGWTQKRDTIAEAGWTQPKKELEGLFRGDDGYAEFLSNCRIMLECTVEDAISAASAQATQHEHWSTFRAFWSALEANFDLTVATVNYDTLIEQALGWGGAEQGFEPAEGSRGWVLRPKRVHAAQRHRLFHLHGSILFKGSAYGDTTCRWNAASGGWDIKWFPSAEEASFAGTANLGRTGYGRELLGGHLITGLHKTDKVAVEPFGTYYEATANELRACPRLLVIGYGFADPHINRLVRRMTRDHEDARRIACVDFIRIPLEIASNSRNGLVEAMHLWSGDRSFRWHDSMFMTGLDPKEPWSSPQGHAQLYWRGFLDAAGRADDVVGFFQR